MEQQTSLVVNGDGNALASRNSITERSERRFTQHQSNKTSVQVHNSVTKVTAAAATNHSAAVEFYRRQHRQQVCSREGQLYSCACLSHIFLSHHILKKIFH